MLKNIKIENLLFFFSNFKGSAYELIIQIIILCYLVILVNFLILNGFFKKQFFLVNFQNFPSKTKNCCTKSVQINFDNCSWEERELVNHNYHVTYEYSRPKEEHNVYSSDDTNKKKFNFQLVHLMYYCSLFECLIYMCGNFKKHKKQ